jgi:glucokinase
MDDGHCVGFDLGGSKMLAVVFDDAFGRVGRRRKRTQAHEGTKSGLARMGDTIAEALEDAAVQPSQLRGIGVGCPGPLDLERGVVLDTPNLGWKNVPVRQTLEDRFECPVAIINDVDAGIYGEYRFGAGRGARCVLGVFPGTGIGGGCVYQGEIFRGTNASCMEIGHLPLWPDGPLCGCGKRGCLEAVASRLAIAGAAAAAAHRGEAPNLLADVGTDLSNIRSGALAAAIRAGDESIERIVREAARHIGMAVAGAINLLAPDVVVLGGGLVEAMPEIFVDTVAEVAAGRVLAPFARNVRVVASELGDDAAVMGAAAWVQHTSQQLSAAGGKSPPKSAAG